MIPPIDNDTHIKQGISFSASKTANILNQVTFRGMVESDFHRQLLPTPPESNCTTTDDFRSG
jgi:hypothetical protein